MANESVNKKSKTKLDEAGIVGVGALGNALTFKETPGTQSAGITGNPFSGLGDKISQTVSGVVDKYTSSQTNNASQGILGSTTPDASGTGANTPGVTQNGDNSRSNITSLNSPTIGSIPSNVNTSNRPALGNINQSTNQDGSTISFNNGAEGTGSITSNKRFSDESLKNLDSQLKLNADPAFQERLKEQAAISQKRYDEFFNQEKQSNLEKNLMNAYRRGDKTGIAIFKDMLSEKNRNDVSREEIATRKDIATLGEESSQLSSANKAKNDYNKFLIENSGKNAELISKLNSDPLATPLQKVSTLKGSKGRLTLGDLNSLLGNDESYIEASKSGKDGIMNYLKDAGIPYEMISQE